MHPSTRFVLAGGGVAAIVAAAYAQPVVPPPLWLKTWIQSTPVTLVEPCPASEKYPSPKAFTFNEKIYQWCLVDGPYKWDNKDWYVQRLKGVGNLPSDTNPTGGPWNDVIRVCSPQAKGHQNTPSPCGPAGPGGCRNCTMNGVPL